MKVYFVRHGASGYNARGIHQPATARLSVCGKNQTKQVANAFRDIPIDVILASPQRRSQETAKIINEVVGRSIIRLYLLQEVRRPSELVGRKKGGPTSKKIKQLFFEKAHDIKWYCSDEENFSDLVARGKRALKYIANRKEEHILVVTHSIILKLLMGLMMFGDELTPDILRRFEKFFGTKNTGITMCTKRPSGSWRMYTWNDYRHLREIK